MAETGHAESASVRSMGAIQRGDFVYEWGTSKAIYNSGRKNGGPYLTVWGRESDGKWRIFRNMGLPSEGRKRRQ